jgi:hypothetical protein
MKNVVKALAAAVLCSAPALAQTSIAHQFQVLPSETNWSVQRPLVSVPKHDPSAGTLLEVMICMSAEASRRFQGEHLGQGNATIALTELDVPFKVFKPGSGGTQTYVETVIPFPAQVFDDLGPFDGAIDYAGASGFDTGWRSTGTSFILVLHGDEMTPYIGTGNVDIPMLFQAETVYTGPGNAIVEARAKGAVRGEVMYIYEPVGP